MVTSNTAEVPVFSIKDCALMALATGKKARLLQEFRSEFSTIDAASIYHHFWGGLLQPRFEEREYNNDFAAWIRHSMHDAVLAERLASIDPFFGNLSELRQQSSELFESHFQGAEQ